MLSPVGPAIYFYGDDENSIVVVTFGPGLSWAIWDLCPTAFVVGQTAFQIDLAVRKLIGHSITKARGKSGP